MFDLSPEEYSTMMLSLKVSLWSVGIILIPGIFTGWLLARYDFIGKSLLDGILHLPLVLPPVVTGYLLLLALGRQGFVGKWLYQQFEISLAFSWRGAVLATALMSFPLMVRSIRLSISNIDIKLEQVSRSLGASALNSFFTVTLPLAIPGIITGSILAFARSLGEFGATITFVGNIEDETRTLPLAIYTYIQVPDGAESAQRLLIISIILALGALLFSGFVEQRTANWLGGK
ncbi:MAG: molybdate ABC transporter permease subunit [Methylococcaceae bacterium]|nr:molybdate ABC transporter permease subunit [Methylococcaceae bacterium]